jgi:hypothetical protein
VFLKIVSDDFPILDKGTRFLPPVALPIRSEILHGICVDVLLDFDAGRQKMMRRLHKIRGNFNNKR